MKLSSYCSHDLKMIIFYRGHAQLIFLLAWTKSRKSYYTTPGVGVGVGVGASVSKRFNVKVFYVMGKVVSRELSCPCDRSCYQNYGPLTIFQ